MALTARAGGGVGGGSLGMVMFLFCLRCSSAALSALCASALPLSGGSDGGGEGEASGDTDGRGQDCHDQLPRYDARD